MGEITTIPELKEALDLSNVLAGHLPVRFEKIAKALLTEFAIQKGEQLFYITDIEFYYYADDHKDFITYPRKCHAGEWFFHASGVDISFKSHIEFDKETFKPILNSDAKFGGILIRSIIPANESLECDAKRLIDHPLNVSDFLFDHFDALGSYKPCPILIECPHLQKLQELPASCERYIKITDEDKKFENVLKYNYAKEPDDVSKDELCNKFKDFLTAKLRYKLE